MNHKDLLDNVIAGMTSKESTKAIEPDEAIDSNDDCITFKLAIGAEIKVDAATFDWDGAVTHLSQMMANEDEFVRLQTGLINAATDDSEIGKKFLSDTVNQLLDYLQQYGINIDYRTICAGLTDHQLAQVLLFDANNVTKTMAHHVAMYDAIKMLTTGPTMTGADFMKGRPEDDITDEEESVYRVDLSAGENGLSIDNIVATDDYPVDEIDVVNDSGAGEYTVYVFASDVMSAGSKAVDLIEAAATPVDDIITEEDE